MTWLGATIAWARPSALDGFTADDLAALGDQQRDRYRALHGDRASGFLAGRALIRDLVLRLGGGPTVRIDSGCRRCGGDHAAPRTPGFSISVSHAADLVVVAVAPGDDPLGVDVEADAEASRLADLAPMFAPQRTPDLAGWTRIEAAIKADGRGIDIDPGGVLLHPARPEPDAHPGGHEVWSAELPGRTSPLRVATVRGPDGYQLSIARC